MSNDNDSEARLASARAALAGAQIDYARAVREHKEATLSDVDFILYEAETMGGGVVKVPGVTVHLGEHPDQVIAEATLEYLRLRLEEDLAAVTAVKS